MVLQVQYPLVGGSSHFRAIAHVGHVLMQAGIGFFTPFWLANFDGEFHMGFSKFNYIYICSPPPQDLCFDIAVRQVRQTQQKHVRAIFSVENNAVMVRHRQELYLSRDG